MTTYCLWATGSSFFPSLPYSALRRPLEPFRDPLETLKGAPEPFKGPPEPFGDTSVPQKPTRALRGLAETKTDSPEAHQSPALVIDPPRGCFFSGVC